MIIGIIREANTEHDIYFLLTSYIEAVRFGDKLNFLPECLTRLPLTGLDDVRGRSAKLVAELDAASKRLDYKTCMVIKEALEIFGAALTRLESFERMSQSQRLAPQTAAGLDWVARDSEASGIEGRHDLGTMAGLSF